MSGTLFIVSTPIGNLEDITLRALRVLKEVTVIAAEDTRHTKELCAHFGIATPLTSYHDFNKEEKTRVLLQRLQGGVDVALVSDAGTPVISDPGYFLITKCIETGLPVVPIPGASAALTALAASGLPTDVFRFEGFLPRKAGARSKRIAAFKDEYGSIILFESPHRIEKLLTALVEELGERRAVLARELTKHFEEFRRGTVEELLADVRRRPPKGEITVIVEGSPNRRAMKLNSAVDEGPETDT
jgi:16S rRNA (cytidine1402-2'-O)-methyltransferase